MGLLQIAGLAGAGGELALPERMAPVNALLDVASPRLREALLVAFLDRLSRLARREVAGARDRSAHSFECPARRL